MKNKNLLLGFFALLNAELIAQNVGIGTATPNASAKLEIADANRGILLPRVSLTGTNDAATVASPANWLIVFNTATAGSGATAVTPGLYYWNGTAWVRLSTGSDGWQILGNAGTNATNNFIGTTDAVDFVARTNNTERMRVTSGGNVGIGTNAPGARLHVTGGATRLEQNAATLQLVGVTGGHSYIEYYPSAIAGGRQAYVGFPTNGSTDFNIYNENTSGNVNISTPFNGTAAEISVRTNGFVGIGTGSPTSPVHLYYTDFANAYNMYNAIGSTPLVQIGTNSTAANIAIGLNGAGGGIGNAIQSKNGSTLTWPLSINPFGGNVGVGVPTPAYALDVVGTIRNNNPIHTGNIATHNLRQHLAVAQFSDCTASPTSSTFLIQTTLPYGVGYMPTVRVWGTAYNEGVIDLLITFHQHLGLIYSPYYVNRGSWNPNGVRVANVGGFIALEITDNNGLYCPKFTVDALDNTGDTYYDGWTVSLAALPGTASNVNTVSQLPLTAAATNAWTLGGNNNGALQMLGTNDNFDLPFETNGTERMRLTTSGFLGVSTNAPTEKIDLGNAAGHNIRLGYTHLGETLSGRGTLLGNNVRASQTAANRVDVAFSTVDAIHGLYAEYTRGFDFFTVPQNHGFAVGTALNIDTYSKLKITNAGNVGVGTTTPAHRMHVNASTTTASYNRNSYAIDRANANVEGAYWWLTNGNFRWALHQDNDGTENLRLWSEGSGTMVQNWEYATGNVGIGIASPSTRLHVAGGQTRLEQNAATLQLVGASGGHSYIEYYPYSTASGRQGYIGFPSNASTDFNMYNENASGNINFSTPFSGGVPELSVRANGNVGIATTAPSRKLDVAGTVRVSSSDAAFTSNNWQRALELNEAGSIMWQRGAGTHAWGIGGTNSPNSTLYFWRSAADDNSQPALYDMRIDNGGRVAIGAAYPVGATFSAHLNVNNGTTVGTYTTTGWVHSSDARLKTNVETIPHALETLQQLRGVSYQWKNAPDQPRQLGFIAQEAEKVLPEVVVTDANGMKGMAYQNITPVVVEAIKEQQAQIEALKAENAALKAKVDQIDLLRAEIEALKAKK